MAERGGGQGGVGQDGAGDSCVWGTADGGDQHSHYLKVAERLRVTGWGGG